MREKARVWYGEWPAACRVLALLNVVVECAVQAGTRRPMTRWDAWRLNNMAPMVGLAAAGACTSNGDTRHGIWIYKICIKYGLPLFEI
jgi:hypothetical protein